MFDYKLESPYNNCLKDPLTFKENKLLINYILNSSRVYSQKVCFDLCFGMNYIESNQCNCTSTQELKYENTLELCYEDQEVFSSIWNCTRDFRRKFSQTIFNEECHKYCPEECDSVSYLVSVSNMNFPLTGDISERDQKTWFRNFQHKTYEEVHKSFFAIDVFYEDLKYTVISQKEKILLSDLISNIGGIIGVFLGSSFLSLFEFVELFIKSLNILNK